MGTGYHGGFGNTAGKKSVSNEKKSKVELPKNKSQMNHIFRDTLGHLKDTSHNRQIIKDLANNESFYKGKDKYGNKWNIKIEKDGKQLWVRYQNGKINEAGRNDKPRPWDKDTGLNMNPFKKRR